MKEPKNKILKMNYIYKSILNKIALMLLLGLMILSCKNQENNTTQNNSSEDHINIQTVEVVHPQNRSFTSDILISGTAKANQTVMLYAMESGVVSSIRYDIGDKVQSGTTIATLKNPAIDELVADASSNLAVGHANIQIQEAALTAAKAKAKGLQSIATRLTEVYTNTPQLTTVADVDAAQANAAEAQAMITSKSALINAQQKVNEGLIKKLEIANNRNNYLNVKAPFSGTITKRYVDKGSLVQNGMNQSNPQALIEIQKTNPIRLTMPVPESDAVYVKKGMDVKVYFPELSSKMYAARISRTSAALDAVSKTMQVEIDIDNNNGKILTGMYAKILLEVDSRDNILSVPVMAKIKFQNEDNILIVEDNIVKRIPIRVGLSDKDNFEVINGTINNNTQVILKGKGLVKPGQTVKTVLK